MNRDIGKAIVAVMVALPRFGLRVVPCGAVGSNFPAGQQPRNAQSPNLFAVSAP